MGTTGTPITGANVTKADIETFINACMEDDITDVSLTEVIKLCMADVSNIGLLGRPPVLRCRHQLIDVRL